METRFDFFKATAPQGGFRITKPEKDSNGYLLVDSTPTRAGVFKYRDSVGNEWGELRHPDDVFSRETMDSLGTVPYTTQENHVELFTPKNARSKIYGATLPNVTRENDHAKVQIKIFEGSEIDAIEGMGSLELSAGYRCDVINESGEYNGEKYDKRQKNIRYNHVARVDNARGGDTCRIRLDSDSAVFGIEADRIDSVSDNKNGESIMKTIEMQFLKVEIGDFRLDADKVEVPAELKGDVDRLQARENTLIDALRKAKERLDSNETESTKKQARIDTLEKENEELKKSNENLIPLEKANEIAEERSYLFKVADDFKLDMKDVKTMSNHEIKKAVCVKAEKVRDTTKLDSEAYCDAVFDTLDLEYEKKKAQSRDNLENHRTDQGQSGETVIDIARKKKGVA